ASDATPSSDLGGTAALDNREQFYPHAGSLAVHAQERHHSFHRLAPLSCLFSGARGSDFWQTSSISDHGFLFRIHYRSDNASELALVAISASHQCPAPPGGRV